jgi:hypothetical protein
MPNQQRLVALLAAACGYIIKFIACNFLTPAVLLSFAALMFTYITLVGPEVPFLRYFSSLLPIDGRGNASINEDDIMKAFGLLTMAFFLLSVIGGWLVRVLKRIFQPAEIGPDETNASASQNPVSSARRRLIPGSIAIVIIFLIVFISIPFARMAEGTSFLAMYPLFAVFGVIAMISNAIYIGVDTLSDVVLGWAWSRVLMGQTVVQAEKQHGR